MVFAHRRRPLICTIFVANDFNKDGGLLATSATGSRLAWGEALKVYRLPQSLFLFVLDPSRFFGHVADDTSGR
jgi:hypothetical protein